MTNIGNVRTLALGGLPQHGPMQIMGGVRGGQSATFDRLLDIASDATSLLQNDTTILSDAERDALNKTLPTPYWQWPVKANAGQVNLRNAYQEGDDDLPLQFAYQAADCRLFYTYENLVRPATVWAAAARAVWGCDGAGNGGTGACVPGSEGGMGSRGHREVLGSKNSTGSSGNEEETGDGNKDSGAARLTSSLVALSAVTLLAILV